MEKNENISIRLATDKDSDDILNLLFNIWVNEFHFDVKREDFPDLREIEASYTKAGGLFLVAVDGGKVIGTIACQKLSDGHFVLKRMFLEKKFRGRGIAQLLLDHLLNIVVFSKQALNATFYLSTKENEAAAAKKFYLKNKFQTVTKDEMPDKFPFFYKDDLFMRRQV